MEWFYGAFALCAIFGLRLHLVFSASIRRLEEIHKFNLARINAGEFDVNEHDRLILQYHDVMSESVVGRVLDLTKWTYRQFYPNPVE